MFYSEKLQSPINAFNVKRLYGVNPDNDPARAALIGILPLTEAPEGYSPTHYEKQGDAYVAVPNEFSNEERENIYRIQKAGADLKELADQYNQVGTAALTEKQPRKRTRKKNAD